MAARRPHPFDWKGLNPRRSVYRAGVVPPPTLLAPRTSWRSSRSEGGAAFLPANACARLAVELPDAAALASAWHALNDAVHAHNEAEEMPGGMEDRLLPLVDQLDLVTTAGVGDDGRAPAEAGDQLAQVVELTRTAATATVAVLRGFSASRAAQLEDRDPRPLRVVATASVLPTVDPRPLDAVTG